MKTLKDHKMRFSLSFFFLFTTALYPAQNESVSLKLSYNTHIMEKGDINNWIESLNSLWLGWKERKGGKLTGQFYSLHYKPSVEGEIRINLISGLAINLALSYLNDKKEGTINFQHEKENKKESQFLQNEVKALPLKIGLSYTLRLPSRFNLSLNAGRYIIFVKYTTTENYEDILTVGEDEFSYWFKKDNKFRSESLGFYTSVGVEYNFTEFLGLEIEGEKIWSKVSGFKGPYSFEEYKSSLPENKREYIEGKASLYYYQNKDENINQYYFVLAGHEQKPENLNFKYLRQGELNFSGFSLKIGLRFRF